MTIGINIKGHILIIDEENLPLIKRHSWQVHKTMHVYYRRKQNLSKSKKFYLHRILMGVDGCPGKKITVDHINRNPLDNRMSNLRLATHKQNCSNRGKIKIKTKSKYIGVEPVQTKSVVWYKPYITNNKQRIRLGKFLKEEDAALAYNEAAIKYFGEFANLNQV